MQDKSKVSGYLFNEKFGTYFQGLDHDQHVPLDGDAPAAEVGGEGLGGPAGENTADDVAMRSGSETGMDFTANFSFDKLIHYWKNNSISSVRKLLDKNFAVNMKLQIRHLTRRYFAQNAQMP